MRLKRPTPTNRTLLLLALGLFLGPVSAWAQQSFQIALNPSLSTYQVNQAGVTLRVAAKNGGVTNLSFSDVVTIGLYANSSVGSPSPQLTDAQAIYTNLAGTVTLGVGTVSPTFTNGAVTMKVIFKTGNDAEAVLVQDAAVTLGNNLGPFAVIGYTTRLFAKTLSGGVTFQPYPPNADILTTDSSGVSNPVDQGVTIPYSPTGATAAILTIGGFSGSYSYGNQPIQTSLWAKKAGGVLASKVSYQVILDYAGSVTDYNNFDPSLYPTYVSTDTVVGGSYSLLPAPSLQTGSVSLSTTSGFTNGQVILRVWDESSSSVTCVLRVKAAAASIASGVTFASNLIVPYSNLNAIVMADLTPKTVLSASAVTMVYTLRNQSSLQIGTTRFNLPPNPGGTGTPWTLASTPTTRGGGVVVTYLNPSGSTPGYVNINWLSAPVTANEQVAVTMVFNPSTDVDQTGWDFGLITVKDVTNNSVNSDSSGALNITTLGVPDTPGSFTAVPSNFTSSGGSVDLSWSQSVSQSPLGYIINRSGGGFTPVTITPSTATNYTDSTAVNLTAYTYSIVAYNAVTQSGSAGAGPVTPFANPSTVTSLTALTGGTTIRLNWTAASMGSYPIAGYQIWRDTQASMATAVSLASVGNVTTFDDTTVSGGTHYYYKLATRDNQYVSGLPGSQHLSGLSGAQGTGFPLGNPPTGLGVSLISATPALAVSWTAPSSAQMLSGPATGYQITISPDGSGSNLVTVGPASYNDAAVTAGHFYVYTVRALDGAGVLSNPVGPVTGYVGPGTPSGLAATPYASSITLTWPKVANSAGETVMSYVIQRVNGGTTVLSSTSTVAPATITYGDGTAALGTNYIYQVAAVDQSSVTGGFSNAVTVAVLPNAPTGLAYVFNTAADNVTLTWATPVPQETNLTTYVRFRSVNGAPITGVSFGAGVTQYNEAFTPADAGSTITYFLQAGNITGYSPASNTVGFQIPPNAPTGLGANSSNSAITLAWSANPGSEKVSKYTIYRDTVPPSGFVSVGSVNSPTVTYTDSNSLSAGVDYIYAVSATNPGGGGYLGGEGLKSASITWGLGPTTPTGLDSFILNTNNDLAVTWTSVTIANANATGVSLLANTTNNAGTAVTTSLAASAVSQFFGAQATDTTYYYWLLTKNPYGVSSLAGPVSQLTYPGAVNLAPVTLASDGVSRIINWSWPGPTPSDVTQYLVYRQLQGTGNWVNTHIFAASGLTLPITLSSPVQPGKDYDYKIVAVNPTGNGPDSNVQSFSTLPSAPVSVTAVSGVSNSTVQVDLTWADPTAAAEGVTAFTVYRATSNTSVTNYSAIASGVVPTSYSDASVTGTGVYYYLIAADDSAGVETFLSTANAVSVTAYASPNPPTAPSASAISGTVTVSWGTVSATTYPVSIYQITKLANGVTVGGLTSTTSPLADTGLTNGVTYVYYFQTLDSQGHASTAAGPVTGVPLAVPQAPQSISVGAGDQELLLTWKAGNPGTLPPGGYAIFSATNPGGPYSPLTVLGPTATGFVDGLPPSPLSNGVTYYYYMQAFDNSGSMTGLHISPNSVTVSGVPVANYVNPPSNLTATAGVAQVILSWTDSVTISGAATVLGYNLYQSVNGAGFVSIGNLPASGASETVTETGLSNGSTYSYYVVAASATTVSSNSATVFGIPAAPPAAPTPLVGVDGIDQAVLTWGASPAQGSITISQYAITRAVLPGAPGLLTTVSGAVTTYTDSNPANDGQTVVYSVAAVNSNGTLGSSSAAVTDYPYASFPPVITGHSGGTTDVAINFNPPGSPSWPVTQYSFVRTPFSGGTAVTVAATGTSSPVTDTSATVGTLYRYQLQALDNKGHSSALSNAVTEGPSVPPAAPTTLLVTAGSQQTLIDWPASAPVSGSIPVSFYIVTVNGTPVTTTNTWFLDDNFGSFYTDPSGVTITIQAVDQSGVTTGNHASPVIGPVTVTTAATDLNPPTGLTATALSTTSVRLYWTAPNDQGYPVTAYSIYRAGSFQPSGGAYVTTIANPAVSPVTTFTDTNLTAASTYYYVVRAVYAQSASVAGPVESPNSNHVVVSTTTPAAGVPPVTSGVMAFDANLIQPLKGETLGIYFIAPNSGSAELDVYNISGNPIRALFANAVAGAQTFLSWDGKDRNGNTVASGIYLIEIKGPGIHQVKKVLVVK